MFLLCFWKTQKNIRRVAKINGLHLEAHLCEQARICFFNTSRGILRFSMLSQIAAFLTSHSKTKNMLLAAAGATYFQWVKLLWHFTEICFPLQPGACHFSRCALNSSQKHVFGDAFLCFSHYVFFSFSSSAVDIVVVAARKAPADGRGGAFIATRAIEFAACCASLDKLRLFRHCFIHVALQAPSRYHPGVLQA